MSGSATMRGCMAFFLKYLLGWFHDKLVWKEFLYSPRDEFFNGSRLRDGEGGEEKEKEKEGRKGWEEELYT